MNLCSIRCDIRALRLLDWPPMLACAFGRIPWRSRSKRPGVAAHNRSSCRRRGLQRLSSGAGGSAERLSVTSAKAVVQSGDAPAYSGDGSVSMKCCSSGTKRHARPDVGMSLFLKMTQITTMYAHRLWPDDRAATPRHRQAHVQIPSKNRQSRAGARAFARVPARERSHMNEKKDST